MKTKVVRIKEASLRRFKKVLAKGRSENYADYLDRLSHLVGVVKNED